MSNEYEKRLKDERRLETIKRYSGAILGWIIVFFGLSLLDSNTSNTYHFTGYDQKGNQGCYSYFIHPDSQDINFSNYKVLQENGGESYKWMEITYTQPSVDDQPPVKSKTMLDIADFKFVDSCDNLPELPRRDTRDSVIDDLSSLMNK